MADIGAGTGKLTENLTEAGPGGYAVEPNDAMRTEACRNSWEGVIWSAGTAEETGLADNSVHWALMGNTCLWNQ